MNDWKRNAERADHAIAYREAASEVKAKAGQTIVDNHSLAEVQAPEYVQTMVDWKFNSDS
jgi:hypothetical protein